MNQYDTSVVAKRALVTGGGAGIGAAIAATLRAAGAEVRTCDINPGSGADYECDVSNDHAVEAMFARLDSDLGGLDICVNNVGVAGPTGVAEDLSAEEFDRCVQVNIGGTFRVAHHAIPRLRAEGRGAIVNISSTAGHWGYPLRSPYVASKWAIEGLTKSWAMELGRFDIRVNCVAPGTIAGERMSGVVDREAASMGLDPADIKAAYKDQVSMRTLIDATDIAAAVTFLCSDAARFVNGEILCVDGNTETLRTGWSDDVRVDRDISF